MKKIVILKDRKIVFYILLSLILCIFTAIALMALIDSIMTEYAVPISIPFVPVLIFFLAYELLIYFLFFKDSVFFISLKESYMNFGTLNMQSVGYENIYDIEFTDSIKLNYHRKHRKIKIFDIEKNEEKYELLLNTLAEKTNVVFDPDEALIALKQAQGKKYETGGKPLRLSSWVMVIFLSFVFMLANGLFVSVYPFIYKLIGTKTLHFGSQVYYSLIQAALSLYIIIVIAKKLKFAVKTIKGFYIISIALSFINTIISFFILEIAPMLWHIVFLVISLLYRISFVFIVFRYLNISERVKRTFILSRSEKVEKADKSLDRGFKLFSKDPASLFTLFRWIVPPVAVVLAVFVLLAVYLLPLGWLSGNNDYDIEYDTNEYSSAQEVIKEKFNDSRYSDFLSENGYYFFVCRDEASFNEKFVFAKNSSGKLVELNFENFDYDDYDWNYYSFDGKEDEVDVYISFDLYTHENNYIMLGDILFYDKPVELYDSEGEVETKSLMGEAYYFEVIESKEFDQGYQIDIYYGDDIIHTITGDDFE